MDGDPGATDWAVATLTGPGGVRFRIAYPTDATPVTDPVAYSYGVGTLEHLDDLVRVAAAVLRPGDRVLDLGAHLGGFALAAVALGCEVLAVEAAPRNAALLRESVAANGFAKLHVVHAAVGDRDGALDFYPAGPWGRVAAPAAGVPTVRVPARRVDDLVADHGWDGVRFVKIDVEGYEPHALRGMCRLLGHRDPPLVYFESNAHTLGLYGAKPEDLKGEFRRLGYKVYLVGPDALTLARPGDDQPEVVADYLAARRLPPALRGWGRPAERSLLGWFARWAGLTGRHVPLASRS